MKHNWKESIVGPLATLREVMLAIDAQGLRIALVINDTGRLLGTITDGDVRRALLHDASMDSNATAFMNSNPITIKRNSSRSDALNLMKSFDAIAIPVIDDDGILVGLETWMETLGGRQRENPVFIMAGGFGTRLRPLTDNCPKPMLKVGDKPLLEIIITRLIDQGFSNFFLSTHYLPSVIKDYFGNGSKWGVSIDYVHEETPLGTGGALSLFPRDKMSGLPMIMMNGDILTTLDFGRMVDFHALSGSIATVGVREYVHQVPFGVIESENGCMVSIMEKPIHKHLINSGIYVIDPVFVSFSEQGRRVDLPECLREKMEKFNSSISLFPIHEYWLDIGRIEDYERAQDDINMLNK